MEISFYAVILAALAVNILGGIWYSPKVFGTTWMRLSGIDMQTSSENRKRKVSTAFAVNFVGSLVMAYVLAVFIRQFGEMNLTGGMTVGFFVWLGFIATTTLGSVLWENKSWKLWLLNNAYSLLSLIVMGAILGII